MFRIVILIGLVLTAAMSLSAATIHVPADQPTIQAGIDAAANGDTVLVSPGVYLENLIMVGRSVTLTGISDSSSTIVSPADPSRSVLNVTGQGENTARISRLTFADGGNNIPSIVISDSSQVVFEKNKFQANHPLRNAGEAVISIAGTYVRAEFKYNLFVNNGGLACIGINGYSGTYVVIRNNTMDGNARGIYGLGSSNSFVTGNIITNSDAYGVYGTFKQQDYNDFYHNAGGDWTGGAMAGAHCISVDPLYENPTSGDYRLQDVSPCIDAGDPNPQWNGPNGSFADMGAYPSPLPRRHNYFIRVPATRPTIQASLEAASSGDTVIVSPGIYYENLDFLGKSVCLISAEGAEATELRPFDTALPIVTISGNMAWDAEVSGFTITGGGSSGSTILISGGARAKIQDNIVRENVGKGTGAAVIRCEGIGTGAAISRNVFYDNGGLACILLVAWGNSLITNNTFDHNSAGISEMGTPYQGDTVLSNIITSCDGTGISGMNLYQLYNDCWNNGINWGGGATPNGTTISADPLFVDTLSHNYRLQAISPCLDSGSPETRAEDPDGTRNDMGAFPVAMANVPPVVHPIGAFAATSGSPLEFHIVAVDANSTIPTLGIIDNPPGGVLIDSGNGSGSLSWTPSALQIGTHITQIVASDGYFADSEDVVIYVDSVGEALAVASLKINGSTHPANVTREAPQIEWQLAPGSGTQSRAEVMINQEEGWNAVNIWSPPIFYTSDTFVSYSGPPLASGDTYLLKMRVGTPDTWNNWRTTYFRINTPPTAPTLYLPYDSEAERNDSAVVLRAKVSTDAELDTLSYDFEVFRDSMLTQVAAQASGVMLTARTIPQTVDWRTPPLADLHAYWWRVRAYDNVEYSSWSGVRSFAIVNNPTPPTAPSLMPGPDSAGNPVYTLTPGFVWTSSSDIDPYDLIRYKLQIGSTPTFGGARTYADLVDTTYIVPTSLSYGGHYYWRVIAGDYYAQETYSTTTKDFWIWTLGDVDYSHNTDIADLSRLIDYLYISFTPIVPQKVADMDGDCRVDISDLSRLIDYLYISFQPLVAGCGP